jgi:hypothetical protein
MAKWSRLALGALALTVAAAGCGARADAPAASPAPSAASPTSSAASPAASPASSPASSPVGVVTLIAFVMVRPGGSGGAIEVSGPDQLDRLVAGPPAAMASARAVIGRSSGPDTRIFAFVLAGCQNDSAALTIRAGRITAALTGGEGTACFAAEWYLAVFAVPAAQVPPGARIG